MKSFDSENPTMDKTLLMRLDSPQRRARRAMFGLSVIGLGALALLDNFHVFGIPLLRTFWPLIFVAWGLARLVWSRHAGSKLFGVVLVVAGGLMTAHNLGNDMLDMRQWWPVFIILVGASILLRGLFPKTRWHRSRFETSALEHSDEIDIDATFGGVKLQNDSRNFKGGKIALNLGGLELDLRQAVMEQAEATLQINASFSGIELRVPRDWQVVVQLSATVGAIEDKSQPPASPAHRLVLRGETVMGAVEIKN
jgi:predicted membrane protein